ncbi:DNA recombination protein RmuC [Halovulum dunhuangense]|uniref:DNA recombination protein RmuC homolog n=1 Tax=Halovulum dunhuangense TaxID=1505036 RepID=A0A849KZS7_9RHOB|nr:DNA recombination protein RmuC [Halovulum dunhuangense]NNU79584.1 DNA recombination protein RmuC [Halovulum dunhuangense]
MPPLDWSDPLTLLAATTAVALPILCLSLLVVLAIRASARAARATEPLAQHLVQLDQALRSLSDAQQRLAGGLSSVAEAQAKAQLSMVHTMEQRLEEVQRQMADSLHGATVRTTRSLTELQERLATIDKAQSNIEKLSGDVLGLQDILSNKQTRGAFGEIQLQDIVSKALPPDAYRFQATLSNGKRADCVIDLPMPPGPIVIDSKFPLEPYEALVRVGAGPAAQGPAREFRQAVRAHIRAIAEKYIIEGETAEGALMFLPSEAVYAELHARFPEVVREGFAARVWIVSPTTCMATLNTLRAVLKDARMREQAGHIRRELGLLFKDVERLGARVENLDRHFGQAARDLAEIRISAEKAGTRARRLEDFEFDTPEVDVPEPALRLGE